MTNTAHARHQLQQPSEGRAAVFDPLSASETRPKRKTVFAETKPYLGLGNRIRSVLGARELARSESRYFCYSWPVGKWFGAALDDLWEFHEPIVGPARRHWLAARFPIKEYDLRWLNQSARSERLWRIRTGQPLPIPSWHDALRALRPVSTLADHIRRFFEEGLAGRPYVGVMIRAHNVAHEETLQHSPVDWYASRMAELRSDHGDIPFFISCDVEEVGQAVASQFGNSYMQTNKGPYNSGEALRASICDLYLLASSGYLLGPHFSSFPELAQILGGDGFMLETSQRQPSDVIIDQRPVLDPTQPWRRAEQADNET